MDDDPGRNNSKLKSEIQQDNSMLQSLFSDWKVFWDGLLTGGEAEEDQDPFLTGKLQALSIEQIKALAKVMSDDRKKLNQRLEGIQKEIDLNSAKLETLKLVGGDPQETIDRISELNDLGQKLSEKLDDLNGKIKTIREFQEEI